MATETTPKNRRWLWYFIAVGLVSVGLVTWLALYIRDQLDPAKQLNLDQLRAARQQWERKNLKDYQMLYKVRRGGDNQDDTFFVEVRGGRVVSVLLNSKHLEPRQLQNHSMDALFNDIELFLKKDAQPDSPQTFCRGYFDTDDGHLMLFVRRVVGGQERVEIRVETLKPTVGN
jgi:hypothetical protein